MNRPATFVLMCMLFLLFSSSAFAGVLMQSIYAEPDMTAQMVKHADFDLDGDLDLVAVGNTWLKIFENDGFQHFTEHAIADLVYGRGVYPCDFDEDGDMDFAVIQYGTDCVSWYENEWGFSFTSHVIDASDQLMSDLVVTDLDSDGDLDIVSVSRQGIHWYSNNNRQEFTGTLVYLNEAYNGYVDAADINADGHMDILYGPAYSTFRWLENDGQEEFETHELPYNYHALKADITSADMDNDGDLDIIVGTESCDIFIWSQDEAGDFSYNLIETQYNLMTDINVVDLNSDGLMDVVATAAGNEYANQALGIWYNQGEGVYNFEHLSTYPERYNDVDVVDLDNDSDIDLIGAGFYGGNTIAWYENHLSGMCVVGVEPEENQGWFSQFGGSLAWNLSCLNLHEEPIFMDIWTVLTRADGTQDDPVLLYEDQEIAVGEVFSQEQEYVIDVQQETGQYILHVYAGQYPTGDYDSNGFTYIVGPNAPTPFSLLGPDYGLFANNINSRLTWEPSRDLDPQNVARFELWVGNQPDLSDAELMASNVASFEWPVPYLEMDQAWYWTVKATDENTDGTWANDTLCFTTDIPDPPETFSVIEPANDIEITSKLDFPINFIWHPTTDEDMFDSVWYAIEFCTNPYFDNANTIDMGQDTVFVLDSLSVDMWFWRVVARDRYGYETPTENRRMLVTMDVDDQLASDIPTEFGITAAYPNPFNPTLSVEIALPEAANLQLRMFNVLGEEVAVLSDAWRAAGYHTFSWNASDHASGVYFLRADMPGHSQLIRKVMLLK